MTIVEFDILDLTLLLDSGKNLDMTSNDLIFSMILLVR